MTITIEYELDQWDWQGNTQQLEIDSEDFEGLSDDEITKEVYERIFADASQKMHFVYPEGDVLNEIKEATTEAEGRAQ